MRMPRLQCLRSTCLVSALLATALFATALLVTALAAARCFAADKADPPAKKDAAKGDKGGKATKPNKVDLTSDVPLERVVLFNSGVGFFDRQGSVKGDAQIELKFNVEDINDLLKSMVLQDMGDGHISAVTYGSKDPITKTLKTFAIDLTSSPTLGQILNQVRGERVEIDAANPITGIILGVETKKKEIGKDRETIDVDMLNLLTDAGLRSVPLENVGTIRLLNEKLDKEFRQALKVLALGHDTDKKTVTLNFLGDGKRDVRVGYIQQAPIWKTSYRLVLKEDAAPFLQGWAIVENTTEEDWNKVDLTLVSGRPISFIMNLYDPLYVQRPVVEPELYASLRPQTYGQDLAAKDAEFDRLQEATKRDGKEQLRRARGSSVAANAPAAPDFAGQGGGGGRQGRQLRGRKRAFDVQQGVQSLSQATNVGELFQYEIATPVTLPRQESAMLPIVNESVKGSKVSIYNQQVQAKHPLNGLRLTNSTALHLMQGPITVFDGGAYAGDARIEDMQPGTERLISYALDLDTEVAPETQGHPDEITQVRLIKGVLHVDHKHQRTNKYTIKNSGKKTKTVLIEYPLDPNWKLMTPKEPAEKTRNQYRFSVEAEPGKPAVLNVLEEQIQNQQIAITNIDDNTIVFYINQKVTSDKVKEALQDVIKRKQQLAKVTQDKQRLEEQVKVIGQEQDRIRQNMAQLDHATDLYKRYVKKFGEQEDEVEKLRGEIKKLIDEEVKQRQALDTFLIGLELS